MYLLVGMANLKFWMVAGILIGICGILVGVFGILDGIMCYLETEYFAFGISAGFIRDYIFGIVYFVFVFGILYCKHKVGSKGFSKSQVLCNNFLHHC